MKDFKAIIGLKLYKIAVKMIGLRLTGGHVIIRGKVYEL